MIPDAEDLVMVSSQSITVHYDVKTIGPIGVNNVVTITTTNKLSIKPLCRKVEEVMRLAAAEEGIEFATTRPSSDDPLWLDEKGFVAAINKIFGNFCACSGNTKVEMDVWSDKK